METTYYRFSNRQCPMSDWGHAMFCDNEDAVTHYGDNEFTYNGLEGTPIEDLHDIIVNAWKKTVENGAEPMYFEGEDAETVFESFNPDDIVESGQAWDCGELCTWFSDNVASVHGINAVILFDGAVVFDEKLIKAVG